MSSPVNVGDILAGKYQVERVLGVGGMGVVVAAKHLTLGERVAIKFLLPQALARGDVVKRFIQEGQAAARLRSEHVARVHDVGKLESGAPFLVMEYLDGNDLGAILRDKGPMSVEAAVDCVLQACEALAEAHSANIVHRDLKPSNLFLIKRLDGSPSIKLIDFGISKVTVPGAEGPEGEMTATAVMMGSPLYMAPEQMASARDVDGRSDIWSLGIILHTMLIGSPPFRAPSVMQVYELIVQGAPPIRKLRADVPEGLEIAILKCLQKDRRQRYSNVGELADAIAEFGPRESRFTADRIKRIIIARAGSDSLPPPAGEAQVQVAAITPAPDGGSAPKPRAIAQTVPADSKEGAAIAAGQRSPDSRKSDDATPPPENLAGSGVSQLGRSSGMDPLGTDGPWDQKTHPPTRRTRPVTLIAAAVAVALIGVPVTFLALRGSNGSTVAPAADSASAIATSGPVSAPSAAGASVTTGAPAPRPPASTASGQPSVAPGTTAPPATPSATADASATVRARPRTPPPYTPPHPPPRPRSPDDLFGTQK